MIYAVPTSVMLSCVARPSAARDVEVSVPWSSVKANLSLRTERSTPPAIPERKSTADYADFTDGKSSFVAHWFASVSSA
jgi:hypothetical protein